MAPHAKSNTADDRPAGGIVAHLFSLEGLLWTALVVAMLFLFLGVVSAPLTLNAMAGLTGGSAIKIWSVICAVCGLGLCVQLAENKASSPEEDEEAKKDPWAVYVLFLVFLAFMNWLVNMAYTGSGQGLMYGHDAPQYYMQLHSLTFDRDADFANEYDLLPRIERDMDNWRPLDIGKAFNVAPVGSAITWMPFYLAAFPAVWLLRTAGIDASYDGVSSPYAMAAAFGSGFLVLIGMLMLYKTLRLWFSSRTSLATGLLLYLATNLTWYISGEPWMSHCSSFFASALVLYLWAGWRPERTFYMWIGLGGAIGLAMLVRPSHAGLLALPIADAILGFAKGKPAALMLARLGVCGVGTLVVFSAQLATWYARSGFGAPPGSPMNWTHPQVLPLLFASQNGLVAWHPVTLLGFLGVPILWRRSRYYAVCIGLTLVLYLYGNAAIEEWSGGGSFGMRRFVGVLPFMAPGIAAIGSACFNLFRRRMWTLGVVGISLAFAYNLALVEQHKEILTPSAAPMPFSHVWSMSGLVTQNAIGHPFSFPANHLFALKHGLKATQYDMLVRNNRGYGTEMTADGMLLASYLGSGWEYSLQQQINGNGFASAKSKDCDIVLTLRRRKSYELVLELAPPAELMLEQSVQFFLNGEKIGEAAIHPGRWNNVRLKLPRRHVRDWLNTVRLSFAFAKEVPYVQNPPPEDSVLGFSDEVKAKYQPTEPYWGALRAIKLKPIEPPKKTPKNP